MVLPYQSASTLLSDTRYFASLHPIRTSLRALSFLERRFSGCSDLALKMLLKQDVYAPGFATFAPHPLSGHPDISRERIDRRVSTHGGLRSIFLVSFPAVFLLLKISPVSSCPHIRTSNVRSSRCSSLGLHKTPVKSGTWPSL